jgi:hypothetical protein
MKKTDKQKLFEAFEKVCGIKLLKEERSPRDVFKNHLIYLIDLDEEENVNKFAKGEDKFKELFKIFKSEKGYELEKGIPIKKSLNSWLRGIPRTIDLPIHTEQIRNLLFSIDIINNKDIDDGEVDRIFYDTVTDIILENI